MAGNAMRDQFKSERLPHGIPQADMEDPLQYDSE